MKRKRNAKVSNEIWFHRLVHEMNHINNFFLLRVVGRKEEKVHSMNEYWPPPRIEYFVLKHVFIFIVCFNLL